MQVMPRYTPKSIESLNTTASSAKNSGGIFYRNTFLQVPRYERMRHQNGVSASSEVQKRVLSAKRLQLKSYQNEIMDAHQIISKLSIENRILRSQIKRQDAELAKYISTNAELPRLLHSHEEEIRIMNEKFRNLFKAKQEVESKLKQKEALILALSDKNKFYSRLNKDKQLDERARLTEKLNAAKEQLQAKEDEIKLINRKLQLEEKKWRQQLQNEQKKVKEITQLLEKTRMELNINHKLEDANFMKTNTVPAYNNLKNFEKANYNDSMDKLLLKTGFALHVDMENTKNTNKIYEKAIKDEIDTAANEVSNSSTNRPDELSDTPSLEYRETHVDDGCVLYAESCETTKKEYQQQSDLLEKKKGKSDSSVSDVHNLKSITTMKSANTESVATVYALPTNKTDEEVVEGISKIRQQITKDTLERETFLDAFCRQASRITLEENSSNSNVSSLCNTSLCVSSTHNTKKQTLLAALKAIDDNKSLD